jgi:hypothetical protein
MIVSIDGPNFSIIYDLNFPPSFPSGLVDALTSQFELLRIAERFATRARDLISGQRPSLIEQLRQGGPEQVKAYLSGLRQAAVIRYGRNHWERVALDSLLDNKDFHTLGHWTELHDVSPIIAGDRPAAGYADD